MLHPLWRRLWLTIGLAGTLSVLASLSAIADEAKLSHLAHLMADEAAGENAPELGLDLSQGLGFGKVTIQMEQTGLEDIQALYGGELHAHQAAAGKVTWLCYARRAVTKARPVTIWFVSTANDSSTGHPISLVAVQKLDAGRSDGCAIIPKEATVPAFDVPGLDTTAAQLKARFGQLPYDQVGNLYYDSVRPVGNGSGKSIYQRLGYVVTKKGLVAGVAIEQSTN